MFPPPRANSYTIVSLGLLLITFTSLLLLPIWISLRCTSLIDADMEYLPVIILRRYYELFGSEAFRALSQAFSTCLDTWCSGVDQGMARVMGGVGLVLAV